MNDAGTRINFRKKQDIKRRGKIGEWFDLKVFSQHLLKNQYTRMPGYHSLGFRYLPKIVSNVDAH